MFDNVGRKLKKIVIIRIGKSGKLLPIDPCKVCQKVANKLKIKIESFEKNKK